MVKLIEIEARLGEFFEAESSEDKDRRLAAAFGLVRAHRLVQKLISGGKPPVPHVDEALDTIQNASASLSAAITMAGEEVNLLWVKDWEELSGLYLTLHREWKQQ